MDKKFLIAPSIFSADFTHLGDQILQAEGAGADWFHIDIMDGHFVPNISMGPFIVETCRRVTNLPLDVHLMIKEPDRYIKDFVDAGADSITVHIETCPQIVSTLDSIHKLGCNAGLTLKPGTPVQEIFPFLDQVELVLVMTVNPGFSGQAFMPEVVPKINEVRKLLDKVNPAALIEVDGGINPETISITQENGAQVFVAASAIFNHPQGIQAGIDSLRDELS